MGPTTKERVQLAREHSISQAPAPEKEAARPPRPHAVVIEIPVVVYGSRYTSVVRQRTEHVEPFREETHTMIVFPQGAVLRLSAKVEPGEMVVVTNQKTGQELVGRIVNVKTRESVKGHAEVEFTQRAAGFWGITFPPEAWGASGAPASPLALADSIAEPSAGPVFTGHASAPLERRESIAAESGAAPMFSATYEGSVISQPLSAVTGQFRRSRRVLLVAGLCLPVLVLSVVAGVVLLQRHRASTEQMPAATPAAPSVAQDPAATNASVAVNAGSMPPTTPGAPAPDAQARAGVQTQVPKAGRDQVVAQQTMAPSVRVGPKETSKPADKTLRRFPISVGTPIVPAVVPKGTSAVGQEAQPPSVTGELPGTSGAQANNVLGGIIPGAPRAGFAPPAGATSKVPVRVGGQVKEPRLLHSLKPNYPILAKRGAVQGDVTIEVVIDTAGNVSGMKAVSGHPLLQQAAMDALRQWKYEPTTLNGEPVPMKMLVTIKFRLN